MWSVLCVLSDPVLSCVSLKASVYISGLMSWALTRSISSTWLQIALGIRPGWALPAVCSLCSLQTERTSLLISGVALSVWNLLCSVECLRVCSSWWPMIISEQPGLAPVYILSLHVCLTWCFSIKPWSGVTSLSVVTAVEWFCYCCVN